MKKENFYSINYFDYEKDGKVERYYYKKLEAGYKYYLQTLTVHPKCSYGGRNDLIVFIDHHPKSKSQWGITAECGFSFGRNFKTIKEALNFLESFDIEKINQAVTNANQFIKRNQDKFKTEEEIKVLEKEIEEE